MNTITGGSLPTGISLIGSNAIVATGPSTAAQGVGRGGWGANIGILTRNGHGYVLPGPAPPH